MFKLMVVSGPNRGTSYPVQPGETSIGRQFGNVIVLESARVSKRHCKLRLENDEVTLEDAGSSNGTFVNGSLTKSKTIHPGDKISVGEFVLELVRPAQKNHDQPLAFVGLGQNHGGQNGNVVPFPGHSMRFPGMQPLSMQLPGVTPPPSQHHQHHQHLQNQGLPNAVSNGLDDQSAFGSQHPPQDLKEKLLWHFERLIMPIFYDMNFKNEWRVIGVGLLGVFVLLNLLISVSPVLDSTRATAIREVGKRARFMARQIVEKNTAALAVQAETKVEIGGIEHEEGVRVALLTDIDSRILAPASKANQHFLLGGEAKFAAKMAKQFREGAEKGRTFEIDDSTIAAVEPVKVYNQQSGKNQIIGMAIVSLDTSLATPSLGEMGIAYSETLIMTGVLAGILLLILYRMTLKPFEVLNDDIDRVLKGNMNQVTHEFKATEMNALWDVINTALQRAASSESSNSSSLSIPPTDDFITPVKMLGEISQLGVIVCDGDRKILYMNPVFEEITGLRVDNVIGQDLPAVARDQAFGSLSTDLFDRASPGLEGSSEEFEFSGVSYKVLVSAFGPSGSVAQGYLMVASRTAA